MKKPPTDCVVSTRVAGPCAACGQPMAPAAHLGVSVARATCSSCCPRCKPPEPLTDVPVVSAEGVQGRLFDAGTWGKFKGQPFRNLRKWLADKSQGGAVHVERMEPEAAPEQMNGAAE